MKEHCWANGDIPANPALISSRLGYAQADGRAGLTARGRQSFEPVPGKPDRLYCPDLEEQRSKLVARSKELSAAGRAGAAARWHGSPIVAPPMATPMANEVMELNKEGKGNMMTTPMATPLGSPSEGARQHETPGGTVPHEK